MKAIEARALKGRAFDGFIKAGISGKDLGVTDSDAAIIMVRDSAKNRAVIKKCGIPMNKIKLSQGWLFVSGKSQLSKVSQ